MSEPTLRPIWTPDDYWRAVRDAAKHAEPENPNLDVPPASTFPEVAGSRDLFRACKCCGAWPDEQCEPGCLNLMTVRQAQRRRDDVLDRTIAELDRLEALPSIRYPDEYHAQAALYCQQVDPPEFVITHGRHRADVGPRWTWYAKTVGAVLVLVLVLTVGALWAATRANADAPGCVTQFWLIPFQSNTRTLCDGPIQADGSWLRGREFWSPAYTTAARSSCSGSYSYRSCTYYPERFVSRRSNGVERYVVTPETVLADEPGHIA